MKISIDSKTIDAETFVISNKNTYGRREINFSFETDTSGIFTDKKFLLSIFNNNKKCSGDAFFTSCNTEVRPYGIIYSYSGMLCDFIQEEISCDSAYIRELKKYDINQILNN